MLNSELKKKALAALNEALDRHNELAESLGSASQKLFELRQWSSEVILGEVEIYVSSLAKAPREYNRTFAEFRSEFSSFESVIQNINQQVKAAAIAAGSQLATGAVAGVGVAAFAPTAALAVATTFGTASTGTAIASLSGAAATNAALAWLGGGALAAGGGGMAAGNALLALAGPIGWGIGASALVLSGIYTSVKNSNIAESAHIKIQEVAAETATMESVNAEIERLISLTQKHTDGMNNMLERLKLAPPPSYAHFNAAQKEQLASLINHVHSLSQLLNKTVGQQ